MEGKMNEKNQAILINLASHFKFSTRTLEERQRLQKSVYVLQGSGMILGYGFGWGPYGPMSNSLIRDYEELDSFSTNSNLSKLTDSSWDKIKEIESLFISKQDARGLELLTSVHYLYESLPENKTILPYKFKKKFRKFKTKTFNDKSPITEEQLNRALVDATNLIAYRNFHDYQLTRPQ